MVLAKILLVIMSYFGSPDFQRTAPTFTFTQLSTPPMYGRDGMKAVEYGGKIHCLGGWNPAQNPVLTNEHWTWDGSVWVQLSNASWTGRHVFGCVVFLSKIWVLMGDYSPQIWSYNGSSWTLEAENLPVLTTRHAAFIGVHNSKIWIIGGINRKYLGEGGADFGYNDVWSSTDGVNWTEVTTIPFAVRGLGGDLVSFNGEMWVIGGGVHLDPFPTGIFYDQTWSSVDGVTWRLRSDNYSMPRKWSDTAVCYNMIWKFMGTDTGAGVNTNHIYTTSNGVTWRKIPNKMAARHASTPVVFNNELYLLNGNVIGCGSICSDFWKITV